MIIPTSTNKKYIKRWQENLYYCNHCGHTIYFDRSEVKKLCSHCGYYTTRSKRSVAENNMIKMLKTKYKKFLEKRSE